MTKRCATSLDTKFPSSSSLSSLKKIMWRAFVGFFWCQPKNEINDLAESRTVGTILSHQCQVAVVYTCETKIKSTD